MLLLIYCKVDEASMNILRNLLEEIEAEREGSFSSLPYYSYSDKVKIVGISKEHIYYDGLDSEIKDKLEIYPEGIVFLSRHRSQSGKRSLTVHPVGNYGEAEYGGRPKELSPSFPEGMSECLRILREVGKSSDYSISFEVTHHGPYLRTPCFFAEIGGDSEAWKDPEAGKIWGEALHLFVEKYVDGIEKRESYIGIGGGHYAPRFSDIASRGIDFGHMISNYYLSADSLRLAASRTPRVGGAYIYKKVKRVRPEIFEEAKRLGLKVFEV